MPLRILAALTLLLTLPFAGCRPRETAVEAARHSRTLLVGNGAEPADLDPHIAVAFTDATLLVALFEGLTVIDEATSQALPGAATSWAISPDGLTLYLSPAPGRRLVQRRPSHR